jgi:hypothetical protein
MFNCLLRLEDRRAFLRFFQGPMACHVVKVLASTAICSFISVILSLKLLRLARQSETFPSRNQISADLISSLVKSERPLLRIRLVTIAVYLSITRRVGLTSIVGKILREPWPWFNFYRGHGSGF